MKWKYNKVLILAKSTKIREVREKKFTKKMRHLRCKLAMVKEAQLS